jgi:hypothetical protein
LHDGLEFLSVLLSRTMLSLTVGQVGIRHPDRAVTKVRTVRVNGTPTCW